MKKQRYDRKKGELERKQGFVAGLRAAYSLVHKTRNFQAHRERHTNGDKDPDLKDNYKFSADVLHAVCLKLQEEIKRARA